MFIHSFRSIYFNFVLVIDSKPVGKQHNSALCGAVRQATDLLYSGKMTNVVKTLIYYGIFQAY